MARKYSHIQEHEKKIPELREQGMTLREIGEKLGFSYRATRECITRYNRRSRQWKQLEQQVLHKYKNLLNRESHAESPNRKWVTDISYIQTKQGVLYLSMSVR